MTDFFDKNLLQNILVSLAFLILSILLASRSGNRVGSTGKGWKVVVVVSYLMLFGGLYLFAGQWSHGGFQNPLVGVGFTMFMLALPLQWVGKFFVWWHR